MASVRDNRFVSFLAGTHWPLLLEAIALMAAGAGGEFIYPSSGGGQVPEGANSCAVVAPAVDGSLIPPWLGALTLALLRRSQRSRLRRM